MKGSFWVVRSVYVTVFSVSSLWQRSSKVSVIGSEELTEVITSLRGREGEKEGERGRGGERGKGGRGREGERKRERL